MRSKLYQNTVRVMTQGRNFKVRFMCITQFAALIDKNAMRYMKQRYFGYTDEPNDVDYIARIVGKNEAEKLQSLDVGEFVYFNRGKLSKIQIKPYENSTVKKQIVIPETKPIAPVPKITQPQSDYKPLLKAAVVRFLGLLWLLLTIGAI
jgi:hypothetical protein